MAHSGTNNGAPSQCRAAAQSTARARNRQEDARVALALAEGNNPIEEGKYYIVCFELNEEPDELFFTLMLATNVSVSLRGHRCVFRCADLENRPSLHLVLVGLNSAVYCDGFQLSRTVSCHVTANTSSHTEVRRAAANHGFVRVAPTCLRPR